MNTNEKRTATVKQRYNVNNVSQLEEVQEKRRMSFAAKRHLLGFNTNTIEHVIDGHILTVYKIHKQIADNWLDRYHPLRAPKGNILCLGLVRKDQLLCLMTFKKSRNKKYIAEMSRMWTLPRYYITDGYDILSHAASEYGLYNVVAYVNLSIEDPAEYEKIGMKNVRINQRTRWWIKDDVKMTDAARRQRGIFVETLLNNGWESVYDLGQAVYEFL